MEDSAYCDCWDSMLSTGSKGWLGCTSHTCFSDLNLMLFSSGAHPASYALGTGGKVAGVWSWPLSLLLVLRSGRCGTILPFPNMPSWHGA
jgi:hypothetical protein